MPSCIVPSIKSDAWNLTVLDLHEVLTGNQDAAARRLDVAVERRQQRGLTRAGVDVYKRQVLAARMVGINIRRAHAIGAQRIQLPIKILIARTHPRITVQDVYKRQR